MLLSPSTVLQRTCPSGPLQACRAQPPCSACQGEPEGFISSGCALSHKGMSTPPRGRASPQFKTLSQWNKSQAAQTTRKIRPGFQVLLSTFENSCITAFRTLCKDSHRFWRAIYHVTLLHIFQLIFFLNLLVYANSRKNIYILKLNL